MADLSTKQSITIPSQGDWGRAWSISLFDFLGCLALLVFSPFVVLYFYISAFSYNGSLVAPIQAWLSGELTLSDVWIKLPSFSSKALTIIGIWFVLQVLLALIPDKLHTIFPNYQGGKQKGATTPAGNRLWYNINGMQAWFISHLLFFSGAFYFNWFSPSIIFDHWGPILIIANLIGFSVGLLAYAKAYLFPSFPEDRKFSGNVIFDFFMGIELNPRIGPLDIKLFFNGRPGIVAWTLINFSFAFAQYERHGFISNSMILVNILHALYVLYFFWKEAWYLNTIDIHHDHFGWYLSWGDSVWLPYMYTLQGLFLVFQPVQLSLGYALFVLTLGLVGFWIFLSANNQKDHFRRKDGHVLIWNKKPSFIPCQYTTKDGEVRQSKLLVSGWWGMARHMNYTGDLILSLAYSMACGYEFFFPYFYFFYMILLLSHRCLRDEDRCRNKYGKAWEQYCQKVPYRIIPGIF